MRKVFSKVVTMAVLSVDVKADYSVGYLVVTMVGKMVEMKVGKRVA